MCKDFVLRVIFLYYHQLSMKINISMIMEKVNLFSIGFFFFFFLWFPLEFGFVFSIDLCISLLELVKKQNSTE